MKKFMKKSLVCMLIITLVVCSPHFVQAGIVGDFIGDLASGLIGIFTWLIRLPFMSLMMGIHGIVTALVKIGAGDIASYGGAAAVDDFFVTPYHIFFNKITILDVNFLNLDVTGTVLTFRTAVAGWYYTMRLISCMVLSVILVYIGIRMAITTIADEKALYKKMLVNWTTSLALLFLLHYIMIFTFACNDALIGALEQASAQITATDQGGTMSTFMTNLTAIALDVAPESLVLSFAAIAVYGIIVIQTLGFVLAYIKRMLNIGFLIIVAPLITITYSIDKIGDNKAQALNTWLKEFVYNILIQPFHCILFMSFAGVAMKLLQTDMSAGDSSIATAVLAVLCIQYVKTGEELIKKIFGFGNAQSLSSMAAGTAMAVGAMAKSKDAGKVVGGAVSKGKNLVANNKEFKALKSSVSKKASEIKGTIKSTHAKKKNERLQDKLDKKAEKEAQKKHGGHATQADIEAMRKQIVADRAAKREKKDIPFISGVKNTAKAGAKKFTSNKLVAGTGKLVKGVASVPFGLARDAGKYMVKNSSGIVSSAVGLTMGVAGLANGGAGFYTGYQAGSGIVQGYMANSNKTIKENIEGLTAAGAALTGMDGESLAYTTTAIGDNDGFKDIQKEIKALLTQLSSKLNCNDNAANQRALNKMQELRIKNPASLNRESIKEIIRADMGDAAANDDKVVDAFTSHMAFEVQGNLYKQINNARETGKTVQDVAEMMGDITAPKPQPTQTVDIETQAEIDYGMLARDIASYVHIASTTISTMDTSSLKAEIAQLNTAINGLNSSDEVHKAQILSAIQKNDQQLANLDIDGVKNQLNQAMQERQRVVNSQSNNP